MRRLRVLSAYPNVGKPNDIVREFPDAQSYVNIGVCEWIDPPEEDEDTSLPPVVVHRTEPPEVTTFLAEPGEIETTTPRPAGVRGARGRRKAVE